MIKCSGSIVKINFQKEDFYILRVSISDETSLLHPNLPKLMGVKGNSSEKLNLSDKIEFEGELEDSNYGLQVKALFLQKEIKITDTDGLKEYLSAEGFSGIGKAKAERLVNQFGLDLINILEKQNERLDEVDYLTIENKNELIKKWNQNKIQQRSLLFLYKLGIGKSTANKIIQTLGLGIEEKIKEDPYILASEVDGIGFRKADAIADRMNIEKNDPKRVKACVLYCMKEAYNTDGHSSVTPFHIVDKILEFGILEQNIATAFKTLISEKKVILEEYDKVPYLTLSEIYMKENVIIKKLFEIRNSPSTLKFNEELKDEVFDRLSDEQREAVKKSLNNKVTIMTGSAGVGKSTVIKAVTNQLKASQVQYLLLAPTGKAAKRITEVSGDPAYTIHRALGIERFLNIGIDDTPLDVKFIILDEFSMVDLDVFYVLMKYVSYDTHLLLVGDINQLSSVGAGCIMKDLIESKKFAYQKLTKIYRQGNESQIIKHAHAINNGNSPKINNNLPDTDMYFFTTEKTKDDLNKFIFDNILNLYFDKIPEKFGFSSTEDIQIITPMQKTLCGVQSINSAIQGRLSLGKSKIEIAEDEFFYLGDKVMQTRNNYNKNVFNGETGKIVSIEFDSIIVDFDGRNVPYDKGELNELVLSYAITIHKSQGSEYPCVIIPITSSHYTMLYRSLFYTAVTRGKKLVVLVGSSKALYMACNRIDDKERITLLTKKLEKFTHKD